jgi:hypothetical protein
VAGLISAPCLYFGARVSLFEVSAGLVIAFLVALCMLDEWTD